MKHMIGQNKSLIEQLHDETLILYKTENFLHFKKIVRLVNKIKRQLSTGEELSTEELALPRKIVYNEVGICEIHELKKDVKWVEMYGAGEHYTLEVEICKKCGLKNKYKSGHKITKIL